MKYGWKLLFIPLWTLCLAGAFLIGFMAFGWVSWSAFVVAGALGLIIGVPAGIWQTRYIRREDPAWPPKNRSV